MADRTLLQTKFSIPVLRERRVERKRLVDKINAGLWQGFDFGRKLTLISAPAGFGKTTLAVEWVQSLKLPVTWLSLEEADNDPARFIAYLIGALQKIESKIGRQAGMPPTGSSQRNWEQPRLSLLVNELAKLGSGFVLVLEDFQHIHSSFIQSQLSYLVEHQPKQMHLVIITREDPLLPLPRLRSLDQVCELRQEDLRFSEAETEIFLHKLLHLELRANDLKALHHRTEGWAVGLQLAALSMQGQENLSEFIRAFTGSNRFILDYLFAEVYNRQLTEIQEFLLKTSLLVRMNAELCDSVLERNDSKDRLQSLEHANLFITPIDLNGDWFRYHGLFKDLLIHQLQKLGGFDQKRIHQRAAAWFESQGQPAEAMQHWLEGEDWENAQTLLNAQLSNMLRSGEIVTLIGWFKRFPKQYVWERAQMCVNFSWPLIFAGDYDAAEKMLSRAEELAPETSPLQGDIMAARAHLARSVGDIQRTIATSERALQLLTEKHPDVRAVIAVNLGMVYWNIGSMNDAEKALLQALQESKSSENAFAWLAAKIYLGRVYAVRGELKQAYSIFQEALASKIQAPVIVLLLLDLGAIHYEWNELDRARGCFDHAVGIARAIENIEFEAASYLLQARLALALGEMEIAQSWLRQSSELALSRDAPVILKNRIAAFHALAALQMGKSLGEVDSTANTGFSPEMDMDPHPFYRFLGLWQERRLIAQGHNAEAGSRLEQKFKRMLEAGWIYGVITALVYRALASDNSSEAIEFLSQALQRSQAGGFIRTYVDAGKQIIPKLVEAARCGVYPEQVAQILEAFETKQTKDGKSGFHLPEPVSERELEVLKLVAAGLSNQEIAEKLNISLGTVKSHLHHLYGKLDVSNRSKAVVRARELRLI